MADTGAPWNLPYPLPTDLVRDGADAIKDLAEATADGLDAAGGLVAVKHVLKTDPFTASVAAGGNVAVTGTNALSITHEVADAANRLIITAFFGSAASSEQQANVALAVHDGTGLIGVGGADGNRVQAGSGGFALGGATSARVIQTPNVTFIHTPGAGSKAYTVRVLNISTSTRTLYVNRQENDNDTTFSARTVSGLIIQEVKV